MSTPDAIGSLTSSVLGSSTSAPPVSEALEPASVRDGSPAVQQDYNEALSFESVLVNQLSQQLVASSGLTGSGSDSSGTSSDSSSSSSGLGDFASLLPGALSSAIMSDGGLGLAAQMLPSIEAANATGSAHSDGSTTTSAGDGATAAT